MSHLSNICLVCCFVLLPFTCAQAESSHSVVKQLEINHQVLSFERDADEIKQTYEPQLYTFSAFKRGHYGLRMYRQTQELKYKGAVWSDLARVASRLNEITTELYEPEAIKAYSEKRIEGYENSDAVRRQLRYEATVEQPEYLFLGIDLLGSMARADEYGLKHREDDKLRAIIRRYDFSKYATDPEMIEAWAAQLANQVYWLKQLGEQDVTEEFIEAFRKTYPDGKDDTLTDQQYMNKLYGLTHIIIAASGYYQHEIKQAEYQWIFDYYRNNMDSIMRRSKEDVIAEIGINFLLAGEYDDPIVTRTKQHIQASIDREHMMVPSVNGSVDLDDGEHRNVLAVMLLNWHKPQAVPTIQKQPAMFSAMPFGLVNKNPLATKK
ncbi:DUF3541 domain-containing protein [Aliivibrio kagoshimensis]|uniref:DUF3541 domain-containing protein n=1 Tax=Aliivibrio kagoshimensis TaxID=2910230 RepID=UPI003D1255A3